MLMTMVMLMMMVVLMTMVVVMLMTMVVLMSRVMLIVVVLLLGACRCCGLGLRKNHTPESSLARTADSAKSL